MKGISTIIASIILVVITIGLISTAYLYFAGIVSVGPVIAIASGYCNASDVIFLTIRNDGTSALDLSDSSFMTRGVQLSTTGGNFPVSTCLSAIAPGNSATCEIDGYGDPETSFGNELYEITVVGPRNQAGGPISCV